MIKRFQILAIFWYKILKNQKNLKKNFNFFDLKKKSKNIW